MIVSVAPVGEVVGIAVPKGLTLAIPIGDGDSGVPGTMVEVTVHSSLKETFQRARYYDILYVVCRMLYDG